MPVTLEQNKSLVRCFVQEILNKDDLAAVDELVAPDSVDHGAPHNQAPGPEGIKRALVVVQGALADLHVVTEHILAESDRVVAGLTTEATHAGPFMGFPPRNRRLRSTTISIFRIADGKIAERWGLMDYRSLQRQLAE